MGFLPEIQATYVVLKAACWQLESIQRALEEEQLDRTDYGLLDSYGHAAMGPVPMSPGWRVVGDWEQTASALPSTKATGVYGLLVGGGWLVMADEMQCCGMMLEPMPWLTLDPHRAHASIDSVLARHGLVGRIVDTSLARVWQHEVFHLGLSYEGRDGSGNKRAVGALGTDQFGQVWRLHYWFSQDHGAILEQAYQTGEI